jgi:hypothetical protein
VKNTRAVELKCNSSKMWGESESESLVHFGATAGSSVLVCLDISQPQIRIKFFSIFVSSVIGLCQCDE